LRNGQADYFAELPPGQAQRNATFSNPRSHMAVDRIGGRPSRPSRHALHPGGANSATSHVLSCGLDTVYKAIVAASENARQRGQRSDWRKSRRVLPGTRGYSEPARCKRAQHMPVREQCDADPNVQIDGSHGTAPGWLIFGGGCPGSEGEPREGGCARQGVMLRSQLRRIMNCSTMRRSSTRRTSPGSSSISAASTTRTRSGSTPRTRCTTFSGDDPPSTSCYRKRSGAQAAIVEQNYHRVSGRSGSPASGLSPP